MKKFLVLLLLLGLQFSYVSCSKENENNAEQALAAETLMNVSYGSNPQQVYDIYLPANRSAAKTKVLILVHGGGWNAGDKAEMDFLIPYIKLRHPNHAIVNMNYVLADATNKAFPNQFLDLGAVIDKLTTKKNELNILPDFGLIGVSAGAQIILMYDYAYDTDNQVKMVADIVGPTDFTDPYYTSNPLFPLLIALVDTSAYPPETNYAQVLSPAFKVSSNSSPTLMFYGNADPLVPLSNAETLNTALTNASIDHNYTVYEGGHADWAPTDFDDMKMQISNYVDTYLEVSE